MSNPTTLGRVIHEDPRGKRRQTSEVPVLDRVHSLLASLGLTEADIALEAHLERAAGEQKSYADLLCELLHTEVSARQDRYLSTRFKMAHLPYQKTLEQFDFSFQPSIDERQINELRTLRFAHDASNVIFLGPPGVGKTHLSVGLAVETVRAGMSAYFITAHDLLQDLTLAAKEARLSKRMQVYLRPRVLIIDEMGYLPLSTLGATLLFQLVSARYERGSIILTSNKSYGDWGSVFGDPVIATAILDRLLHHSTTINIRGESYRLKERKKAGLMGSSSPGSSSPGSSGTCGTSGTSGTAASRGKRNVTPSGEANTPEGAFGVSMDDLRMDGLREETDASAEDV